MYKRQCNTTGGNDVNVGSTVRRDTGALRDNTASTGQGGGSTVVSGPSGTGNDRSCDGEDTAMATEHTDSSEQWVILTPDRAGYKTKLATSFQ